MAHTLIDIMYEHYKDTLLNYKRLYHIIKHPKMKLYWYPTYQKVI